MKEELDIKVPIALSPLRKNKRGQPIHISQKLIIINLYKKLKEDDPNIFNKDAITQLAEQTGIGSSSIQRMLLEYKRTGVVKSSNKKKRRLTLKEKIDEFDKTAIRKKVHEFYFNKELPTLRKVLQAVNDDDNLPNFKRSTFHVFLKELNFTYTTTRHGSRIMTEKEDLIVWRRNYLRAIRRYREEGRPIYYLDETRVNAGDVTNIVWVDETMIKSEEDAFSEGLSATSTNQRRRDKGLIALHIGSAAGFVPGGLLCLESEKHKGNYHDEMNGDMFLDWFKNILPSLNDNAVIVMDNAPCHSVKLEEVPDSSWKKFDIIRWLEGKGREISETLVKAELLQVVAQLKDKFDNYVIDEMAKQNGKTVVRLPPYHCELNPIGMVWPIVKEYVKSNNYIFPKQDVKVLVERGFDRVTTEHWRNFAKQVEDEEKKMWEIDSTADNLIDAMLALTDDTTGETNSETSDSDY